jgi:succinate-acetate transporter protein
MEFKKGNTFGTTAFTSYGLFWLTLVALIVMPKMGLADPTPHEFMGCYLLLRGIFTLFMFLRTLKSNKVLQFIFFSLTVLFFLLAIGDFSGNHSISTIAGWEGIVCGASAFYLAMAEVINEQFGRTVLPIGE